MFTNVPNHFKEYLSARHEANREVYSEKSRKAWGITRDYHREAIFNPDIRKPYFDFDEKGNLKVDYVEPDHKIPFDYLLEWWNK